MQQVPVLPARVVVLLLHADRGIGRPAGPGLLRPVPGELPLLHRRQVLRQHDHHHDRQFYAYSVRGGVALESWEEKGRRGEGEGGYTNKRKKSWDRGKSEVKEGCCLAINKDELTSWEKGWHTAVDGLGIWGWLVTYMAGRHLIIHGLQSISRQVWTISLSTLQNHLYKNLAWQHVHTIYLMNRYESVEEFQHGLLQVGAEDGCVISRLQPC